MIFLMTHGLASRPEARRQTDRIDRSECCIALPGLGGYAVSPPTRAGELESISTDHIDRADVHHQSPRCFYINL
jgi:hypothetical protein